MTTEADDGEPGLTPDEAFALLGNETRMEILQSLGDADGPVAFSALRDAVGVSDSGQFNYHLDQIVGAFVRRTDDGYELLRAGERVIEAVLSGAVTDRPVISPTPIDRPCPRCGGPIQATYRSDWVALSCTECDGLYASSGVPRRPEFPDAVIDQGYLGGLALPPAGVHGRTAAEVVDAAEVWGTLETLAASHGLCPRCSAAMEPTIRVCDDHDTGDGICTVCGFRDPVSVESNCTNCPHDAAGNLTVFLAGRTVVIDFVSDHGHNPITPGDLFARLDMAIELRSVDPFEAVLRYEIEGDRMAVHVDGDLAITEVERDTS